MSVLSLVGFSAAAAYTVAKRRPPKTGHGCGFRLGRRAISSRR